MPFFETPAALRHPVHHAGRFSDHRTSNVLVVIPACYPQQVAPVFVLGIGFVQEFAWGIVHDTEVAGMPAISAPQVFRGLFQQKHRCSGLACRDGCTNPGVSPADNQDVVGF